MYSQNRRKDNTEKIILIMLVINYSFMIFSALKLKWSTWLPTFMVAVAAVSVVSYVGAAALYFSFSGIARAVTGSAIKSAAAAEKYLNKLDFSVLFIINSRV